MSRGIVIAGTNSGCGKTTVCMGITSLLVESGLSVQTFKVGPDYIDPGFHSRISGRASINLDSWVNSEAEICSLYQKYSCDADFSVVEGVMGLFDGAADNPELGSTASVARMLDLPVLLVVNAAGLGHSVAAVVKGYTTLDSRLRFAGILLNNVGSDKHLSILIGAISSCSDLPVVGYINRLTDLELKSRHLGLRLASEVDESFFTGILQQFSRLELDLDQLTGGRVEPALFDVSKSRAFLHPVVGGKKACIARDPAFSFYYHENLKILEDYGFQISFFSPIDDEKIPDDADFVYLGGGYPELHADELASNSSMLASVRRYAESGKPMFAECGGFVYLAQEIVPPGYNGEPFQMAAVFPLKISFGKKKLSYVDMKINGHCFFGRSGVRVRGHEYHYTSEEWIDGSCCEQYCRPFLVSLSGDGSADNGGREAGYRYKNTIGSYIHLFFSSNREIIRHLANAH